MCIRYEVSTGNLFKWSAATNEWISYEEYFDRLGTFPQMTAPVITQTPLGRHLNDMIWGLNPSWSTDPDFGKKYAYNARSETLHEKPAFRDAFASRRCIIPASAYWEQDNGHWYRVLPTQGEYFAFAGLYEPPGILPQPSFTIVTTVSNAKVEHLNDRMPVVLAKHHIDEWMAFDAKPYNLKTLMQPCMNEWLLVEDMGTNKRKDKPKTIPMDFS